MKKLMTGNEAAALAAKMARTQVIAAYPITPQTSIAEKLAAYAAQGEMKTRYIKVESETSALAACIGGSLSGARVFTATSSQGLALMHELLHWASGARLPIVLVDVNRSMAAPWSLGVDHNDTLSQRDTGCLQIYCETAQEVFDTILQIGRVTRTEARAQILVRSLRGRADRIIQACAPLPRPRVFLQINDQPLITVGRPTFHHHLITLLGGDNISGRESIAYPKYSLEQVLRVRPEVILITTMERGANAERKKDFWKSWDRIPAVAAGRIHLLNSDLLDRSGPRLVDGLEALAWAIHPELRHKKL